MASMDYCYWGGRRCRYKNYPDAPRAMYCDFHEAFMRDEPEAMMAALSRDAEIPVGVTLSCPEKTPNGAWAFVVSANPEP